MRRFSVFVITATADIFGFSDAPSATSINPPAIAATVAATVIGTDPVNSAVEPKIIPPDGGLVSGAINAPSATALASEISMSTGFGPLNSSGSDSRPSILSPADPAQTMTNYSIPDGAAGGIGSYLNQIAAELSANLETTTGPGVNNATVESGSTKAASAKVTSPGYAAANVSSSPAMNANIPQGPGSAAPSPYTDGVVVPAVEATTAGWSTDTDLITITSSLMASTTIIEGDLIAAMESERRQESTMGTAAAAGGVFLLGAGACALYARNRRTTPAELSRFGSPQRRTSSDLPRRFVPV